MTFVNGAPWCQQSNFNSSQSGDLSSAFNSGTSLPTGLQFGQAIVTRNKIHILAATSYANAPYYTSTPYNYLVTGEIDSSGVITSFSTSALTMPVYDGKLVAIGSSLYLFSGYDTSINGYRNRVYRAEIYNDGTIGDFGGGYYGEEPVSRGGHVFVVNGILHKITGASAYIYPESSDNGVRKTTILSDGSLDYSSWPYLLFTNGSSLSYAVSYSCLVKTSSRVYLIGGRTGSSTCCGTVQSAPINGDGTLGTWSTDSGLNLPSSKVLWGANAVVTEDAFYIVGGWDGVSGSSNTTVFYGAINSSGVITSISTSSRSLSASRLHAVAAVTSSRLYILGGLSSGSTVLSSTEYVPFSGGLNDYRAEFGFPVPVEADGAVVQDEPISFAYGQNGNILGYVEQEAPTASGEARNPIQCYGTVEQGEIAGAGYGNAYLRGTGVVEQGTPDHVGLAHIVLIASGSAEQGEPASEGLMLNGVGCVGRPEQECPVVSALGTYPTVGKGRVIQLLSQGSGSASIGPYPAYGVIEQDEPVSFGTAIFGSLGTGEVDQGVSTQTGVATYPTVGFGIVDQGGPKAEADADMFQACFGRVDQEPSESVATAESLYTDQGSVEQESPEISASATVYVLGWGSVDHESPDVSAYATISLVGWGVVEQEFAELTSSASSLYPKSGSVDQDCPEVSGYATVSLVGWGVVEQEFAEGAAFGGVPCIGVGDVYSEPPDILSTAYIIGLGFGNTYQDEPAITAVGVVPVVGYGSIFQEAPKVSTYSDLADANLHLGFSRCTGALPILSPVGQVTPQKFSRCSAESIGSTAPAGTTPFHFSRCS